MVMLRVILVVGLMVVGVVGVLPGEVWADNEVQNVTQRYEVEARDIFGTATTIQNFTVMTDMENMTVQRFKVMAYTPEMALSVGGMDTLNLTAGGAMEMDNMRVEVWSGAANGYVLGYAFENSDMICEDDGNLVIPTVATEGALTGSAWGYNEISGVGEVPESWLPGLTTPTVLTRTIVPMGEGELDGWWIAVGARASQAQAACIYKNVMVWTLVGNS